ncbi:MAG: redoxin domain-containing protein [Gammaproteobacteria bacterium]|nr:redoxin domain-containing protein [Gammaproteobacteria bacterium]
MKSLLPLSLIVALVLALGWLLGSPQSELLEQQKVRGGGFTLQSADGAVSLSDFQDKVVLLYFGYTWCPDICPTNLSLMSAAFAEMEPELLKKVQGIFISVDPDRDSPERLKEYTNFFHENIIGITGTAEQIAELAGRYGVGYRLVKQESATDYVVDHTSETYVIDGHGEWVDSLPHAAPPEDITKSIVTHLQVSATE